MGVVTVELTRWDLARFNLDYTVRQRFTWYVWIFFAACCATPLIAASGIPRSLGRLLIVIAVATLVPTLVMLLGTLVSMCIVAIWAGSSRGVLGPHTYAFEADGLRERTSANDTLIKWGGAQDVRKIGRTIAIKISPALFHILPDRFFASPADYANFWEAAQRLRADGPRNES